MKFESLADNNTSHQLELEPELSEEEILNSNNIELIVEYAKEARSQQAIDRARELIELSRNTGEEVVQNFLKSFAQCQQEGLDYIKFEKTESGQLALEFLDKMPEPFKAKALTRLEEYKENLRSNSDLYEAQKNTPEVIWKEVFGLDYYNKSEASEKLKALLFEISGANFKDHYKDKELKVEQDPFAINLFVGDSKSFNEAIEVISTRDIEDAHNKVGGFSIETDEASINVLNVANSYHKDADKIVKKNVIHESEHAIHRRANPFEIKEIASRSLMEELGFEENVKAMNQCMRSDFTERLKKVKDESFAYLKGDFEREAVRKLLKNRGPEALYDYNKEIRELNNEVININKNLSEEEKDKLRKGINFFQLEYERVLDNVFDMVYDGKKSVEFLRNVPINELWKYSDGKYKRTDFLIREFKI